MAVNDGSKISAMKQAIIVLSKPYTNIDFGLFV